MDEMNEIDEIRIQIVNYKTRQYLLRCLETVVADLGGVDIRWSVGILDNASGDDLSDVPKKFPTATIDVVMNPKNVE